MTTANANTNTAKSKTISALRAEIVRRYRTPSLGDVRIVDSDASSPSTFAERSAVWGHYAKSCKYPATEIVVTVCVNIAARSRAVRAGIGTVDGLVTLSATRQSTGVWRAAWLEQGKGYDLRIVTGAIASVDGVYSHGDTISKAVACSERKAKAKAKAEANATEKARLDEIAGWIPEEIRSEAQLGVHPGKIVEALVSHPDRVLTVDDVRATGACETGIRSWCATVVLDRDSVSIAEACALLAQRPSPYLGRAIAAVAAR